MVSPPPTHSCCQVPWPLEAGALSVAERGPALVLVGSIFPPSSPPPRTRESLPPSNKAALLLK